MIIGWTITGQPIRSAAARTACVVGEVEGDAAALGLVRACGGRLDDDGVAEVGRCRRCLLGGRGEPLSDQGEAVGGEQAPRGGGSSQA